MKKLSKIVSLTYLAVCLGLVLLGAFKIMPQSYVTGWILYCGAQALFILGAYYLLLILVRNECRECKNDKKS